MPTNILIPTLALSLALLPNGLQPVAVFPPFENPRTMEAVGLIFTEEMDMSEAVDEEAMNRLLRRRRIGRFRRSRQKKELWKHGLRKRDLVRLQEAVGMKRFLCKP